ncbi:hypothetical protein RB595_003693 [Gaeumannomyces hyphopodioides]
MPILNPEAAAASAPLQVRLITHNVRFATKTPSPGERPWSERCPRLCAQLSFTTAGRDASFVCLQEVLRPQLRDVVDRLNGRSGSSSDGDWAHVGVGREDGREAGEHSPILYRRSAWECERQRTYWLSETPDRPSRGWDADLPRIVTVGRFRRREGGASSVVVMSTHLDHRGPTARRESAKLLLRIAAEWAKGGGGGGDGDGADGGVSAAGAAPALTVFLGGDFNSKPDGGAYQEMTAPGSGMADASTLLREEDWYGNHDFTYTSFGEPDETPGKIDFLFVRDPAPSAAKVLTFGVLANRFDDDGVYLSDHRAVVADVDISHTTASAI